MKTNLKNLVALALLGSCLVSYASTLPVPGGPQLTLDAQAQAELDNDEMSVVMSVEKQGSDVQALSQSVLATLQRATAKAKRVDSVSVRTGTVSTYPVWDSKGKTPNWTVRAEMGLKSTNFSTLGLLASELTSEMQMNGVGFSLSPAKRKLEESRLMKEVSANFKDNARDLAAAMGYKSYELKSLSFNRQNNSGGGRPMMTMSAMRGKAMDAAVPVAAEGGKSEVSVSLNGVVELK